MAEEKLIEADPDFLNQSPLSGLLSGLAGILVTTPDVSVERTNSTGSDYVVLMVVGVIVAVLLIGTYLIYTKKGR
jgi:hypothetical protein